MKHAILSLVTNRMNIENLIHYSKNRLILPFYHTVSDDYLPHIHPLYRPKTIKEFEQDLDFLMTHFHPVSMEEISVHNKNKQLLAKPSFHISFDDGLREIYDIVFPILTQKGIPFTVFVNSAFVDNQDLFFRYKAALIIDRLKENGFLKTADEIWSITYQQKGLLDQIANELGIDFSDFLKEQRPYLTLDELNKMHAQGVSIGAHSIDHPLFGDLSLEEQVRQTLESCRFVKENFDNSSTCFAFPFTDASVSSSFFSRVYPSVDLTFGITGIQFQQDNRHMGRIDMEKYGKNAEECIKKAYLISILKNRRSNGTKES